MTGRAGTSGTSSAARDGAQAHTTSRARRPGRRTLAAWAGTTALLLALAPAASGRAGEPQRVQVVGSHPIRTSERAKTSARDQAIEQALWEGVSRVAQTLLEDEGVAEDLPTAGAGGAEGEASDAAPDQTARFRTIFGPQILPYTRSYRIVEDRGERPVLFSDDSGVRSEYLVVVEVAVDVDRVRRELARAGLLGTDGGAAVERRSLTLELVGIRRHAGLQRVLEALRRELGATRIETLEFSPARQVLRLESPLGPEALAERLARLDSAELILDPVEIDRERGRIRVLAQWLEPVPAGEAGAPAVAPATIEP